MDNYVHVVPLKKLMMENVQKNKLNNMKYNYSKLSGSAKCRRVKFRAMKRANETAARYKVKGKKVLSGVKVLC